MNNLNIKKYLPFLLIMLSVVLLLGTSYALLRSSQVGENPYVMNVGLLEVTFQDANTNALTLENMFPMTDTEGMEIDKELEFTVKNTGTLPAKYNIYIEETSTSPEFKSVIRFISNKNNTTYNNPQTLSENNFIDSLATLDVGESATYKVKVWLAEEADSTYMNKTFTARVVVDVIQGNAPARSLLDKSISESTCNPSVTDDDGTIYLSGTNDCVNFNYVWYSGKLWRITALYPDGTMKMITNDLMTAISYGANTSFYTDENTTSYMYQWLNQEFLPTLYNYEEMIVENAVWNASAGDGTVSSKLPIEGQEEVLVNADVGLLNSYEYYMSYKNASLGYTNGYLNINHYWWILNPYNVSSARAWYIDSSGSHGDISPGNMYGVRPSINLKSTIQFIDGTGTLTNPYRIKGDSESIDENVTLINTRQSGEYVKLVDEKTTSIFRIVGTETTDGTTTTKLVLDDYVRDTNDFDTDGNTTEVLTRAFGTTNSWSEVSETDTTYWRGYLNIIWLKQIDLSYDSETDTSDILEKGIYYSGNIPYLGNYKLAVCMVGDSKKSVQDCIDENTEENPTIQMNVKNYVGLLRIGELFTNQFISNFHGNSYLITKANANIWYIDYRSKTGYVSPKDSNVAARPTIHLKSEIVIKSGTGTEQDPFVVGLPS